MYENSIIVTGGYVNLRTEKSKGQIDSYLKCCTYNKWCCLWFFPSRETLETCDTSK